MRNRFALASMLNLVSTGLGLVISMTVTPFVLHTLGKEPYGVWVLVTSFSVVSGYLSLLDLGIQSAVIKFVAEHYARHENDKINQVFSAGLYFFVIMGFLGAIVLTLFAQFFLARVFAIPPELVDITRLLLYLLAAQTLIEFPGLIFSAVIEGLQRYDLQRAIQIGAVILYAVLLITLLMYGYGLMALTIPLLVLAIVKSLVMAIIAWQLLPGLRLVRDFDIRLLRSIAIYSWQLFLIRINAVVYNTMDKTIIGAMLNVSQLTSYDIANKFRNITIATLSFINLQMVSATAHVHGGGDRIRLQELFLKGTKYQLAVTVPVVISVLVLVERFINLWIGPDYAYTASLARLFVSSVFLDAIICIGQSMMFSINRVKPVLLISIISCGINLIVSIILTIKIGVAGVMWGTLIGLALSVIPYLKLFLSSLDLSLKRLWSEVLCPVSLVAIVFTGFLYGANQLLISNSLWMLGGIGLCGLAVYGVLFLVLGMGRDERLMVMQTVLQATKLRP